ncbi:MAG: hypothetical protein AAGF75_06765, partial [Cyanobacteria bacterium P01_H01_bin.130]
FSRCFSPGRREYYGGLIIAVLFALLFGGLAIAEAFGGDYIVQDDARQYVFWMQRWQDPSLFTNDLIADYFSSIAPAGYRALFYGAHLVSIPPLIFAKILPLGLGVAIAVLGYRVTYRWCPTPLAGFLGSLLLQQSLWMKDDLAAAAPRSFAIPLLLAFMDAWLMRRDRPRLALTYGLTTLALLGLLSPPYLLIAAGMLGLSILTIPPISRLGQWRAWVVGDRQTWQWLIWGWGVTLAVLLPYVAATDGYGPTVSAALGRTMAEFRAGGRASLFDQDGWEFWIVGKRTNFFPKSLFTPITLIPGALFPFWTLWQCQGHHSAPKPRPNNFLSLNPEASQLILKLLLSSTLLFLLAHATLFTLHLPSRYTGHSLRIAIALTSGVAWTLILQSLLTQPRHLRRPKHILAIAVGLGILLGILAYPLTISSFPLTGYKIGSAPELYHYLQRQPKTIRIGSIAKEADQIPTFAARTIIASKEYSVPYQLGYYRQIQRRMGDQITAQYTTDPAQLRQIIQRYGITHWLLDANAYTVNYLANNGWLKQYQPATDQAIQTLQAIAPAPAPDPASPSLPLILQNRDRCQIPIPLATEGPAPRWQLLDAGCLLKDGPSSGEATSPTTNSVMFPQ